MTLPFFIRMYRQDTINALCRGYCALVARGDMMIADAIEKARRLRETDLTQLSVLYDAYVDVVPVLGPVAFYIPSAIDLLQRYARGESLPSYMPDFPPPLLHNFVRDFAEN